MLSLQSDNQSEELREAEQLSAQVVKLYEAGKYDTALPLAERALALRQKVLGEEHQLVAVSLYNLAAIQFAKKKNKEAEAIYDRYLSVYGKVIGESDQKFITALEHYICLLIGINNKTKALEIQKRLYKLDNGFAYDESLNMSGNNPRGLMNSTKMPRPDYSAEARRAGISGSVVMKITVDETGKVVAVKILCGHLLLVKGTEPVIWRAEYEPKIIAGKAVKVTGIVIYNFIGR